MRRSNCPIACSLDLLGDRWTLLVIRDLLQGKTRYGEFLASPEKIATNILAERLRRLEAAGLVSTARYGGHSRRVEYQLTPAGRDLGPVVLSLVDWGLRHITDTRSIGKLPTDAATAV
jgi:DNA-binding HxlR family transcriptional regulator